MQDRCWCLTQLGISYGGLGLRDAVKHSSSAYLASVSQARTLCEHIDPHFDFSDATGGLHLRETEALLRENVLEAATWDLSADDAPSQKHLSGLIDEATRSRLHAEFESDPLFRAHMQLCTVAGSGAWLTSRPIDDGRHITTPLFRASMKRRLRMPVADVKTA